MLPARVNPAKHGGASLIEALVVLVIAALTILTLTYVLAGSRKQARAMDGAATQAVEMAQLTTAALRYGDSIKSTLTQGQRFDANPATLISAGFLKSSFAERFGAAGTTPLGQTYQAAGMIDPVSSNTQVVAWVSGTPSAQQAVASGLVLNAVSEQGYAQSVGNHMPADQAMAFAVLATNSKTAVSPQGQFSLDVSAWVTSAPQVPSPAILGGFALLGAPVPPPPPPAVGANCNVLMPNSASSLPSCPTGTKQLGQWPVCAQANPYVSMPYSVFGTQAGIVTVGTRSTTIPRYDLACWFGPYAPYCPSSGGVWDVEVEAIVLVNGAEVHQDRNCGGFESVVSNDDLTLTQVPRTNNLVPAFKTYAIEQLCCAQ